MFKYVDENHVDRNHVDTHRVDRNHDDRNHDDRNHVDRNHVDKIMLIKIILIKIILIKIIFERTGVLNMLSTPLAGDRTGERSVAGSDFSTVSLRILGGRDLILICVQGDEQ